jgi:hypothetical protein
MFVCLIDEMWVALVLVGVGNLSWLAVIQNQNFKKQNSWHAMLREKRLCHKF